MEERNVWTIFDESKENKDIIIVPFIYSGDAVQCSKSTGGVYTLPSGSGRSIVESPS
jgi:hypothetical protein